MTKQSYSVLLWQRCHMLHFFAKYVNANELSTSMTARLLLWKTRDTRNSHRLTLGQMRRESPVRDKLEPVERPSLTWKTSIVLPSQNRPRVPSVRLRCLRRLRTRPSFFLAHRCAPDAPARPWERGQILFFIRELRCGQLGNRGRHSETWLMNAWS